jgi:hypothetical protein|tara:strand:- start:495 stop:1148 length:654 start_codon:yes stop_codon:yes gene_type:complete
VNSFYTPTGIHVYFKDRMMNDKVDVENVISKVESTVPSHLLSEVEMIIVGWFEEFEKRKLNAFYKDGTLYISNVQDDEEDMYDDIVHEVAHSLESALGYEIYSDQKIKDEFLRKRKYMYDILWNKGYKTPLGVYMNPEYDEEFDMFLYKKIGYDKLFQLLKGLFITPYAATSLREYYATGFTEFYLDSNHNFFKKVSPELYKKILLLQDPEKLDKAT